MAKENYAHAVIEDHEAGVVYQPGDKITTDVPGFDELVEGGAISSEQYVEPPPLMPDEVDIGGVVYKRSQDNGSAKEKTA